MPPPRALALCLAFVVSASAAAQPDFTSSASVDQEAYAYGETITFRFVVKNESGEAATIWDDSGCGPFLQFGTLTTPGEAGACTTAEIEHDLPVRGTVTWVWLLDPAALGVPETEGRHTIRASLSGPCGVGEDDRADRCSVRDSASFRAPRFLGGPLRVTYDLADVDDVVALKREYRASVTDSSSHRDRVFETWQVEGTPLLDAADALSASGTFEQVLLGREVYPHSVSFATPTQRGPAPAVVTPPAPNPTATTTAFTVRLAAPEAVVIDLVDALGRRIAVLHNGPLAADADHRFRLSTDALPTGVYTVRVVGRTVRQSRRVTVAR